MAEPNFALIGDESADDLPRTLRRERDNREREARERAARERAAAPSLSANPDTFAPKAATVYAEVPADVSGPIVEMPYPASVRRFDVPFMHLVAFFLKAVIAAIPAFILLGGLLWLGGHVMQTYFPDLVKYKILIGVQP